MAECVYCGSFEKLTREHVMPSFIYKMHQDVAASRALSWNENPGKFLFNEAVVKDVCANCNNIVLSAYDAHAKKILEDINISQRNFSEKNVFLSFNYEMLAKWLLKVSYNSSRANSNNVKEFESFKGCIINSSKDHPGYFICAGLLKPLKLTESELLSHGQELAANAKGYVNPFFTRISWMTTGPERHSVKQIVIGALVFHVCVFLPGVSRQDKKSIKKQHILKFKGMSVFSKNSTGSMVLQMPITFADSLKDQMARDNVAAEIESFLTSH